MAWPRWRRAARRGRARRAGASLPRASAGRWAAARGRARRAGGSSPLAPAGRWATARGRALPDASSLAPRRGSSSPPRPAGHAPPRTCLAESSRPRPAPTAPTGPPLQVWVGSLRGRRIASQLAEGAECVAAFGLRLESVLGTQNTVRDAFLRLGHAVGDSLSKGDTVLRGGASS